jgi:hypothetical protein
LKTGIPGDEFARARTRFEEALSEDRKRFGNAGMQVYLAALHQLKDMAQ